MCSVSPLIRSVKMAICTSGEPVSASVDMLPAFWKSGQSYLRIKQLPVEEFANEVLVIRLDFDEPPAW